MGEVNAPGKTTTGGARVGIRSSSPAPARLALVALGVVFGDLGTSPLYTLQECLSGTHGVSPTDANVLGILSLIFWSLMIVVSFKYTLVLMRADNHGEGGIMALLALMPEKLRSPGPGKVGLVALLTICGAALLFGDGVVTPAVSVLSAIEGIEVASPSLHRAVLPVTIAILLAVFALQRSGTAKLGRLFGPVMLLWFGTAATLGVVHLVKAPAALRALSPTYAVAYFGEHGLHGVTILGGVILCLTGAEALYADMGHFGKTPIRMAWFAVCVPALLLNYFGQGALLLSTPEGPARAAIAARPFYALCPQGPLLYPFVGIAALATIIASQALISGVFSLTHQAVQLGLLPRVTVQHTSAEAEGQIYLPLMNWGLAIACVALVLLFQASAKLTAAYGLAVSGTMAITSVTFFYVTHYTWRWALWKSIGLLVLFLSFDLPFLVANSLKFLDGGYVPVAIGGVFVVVMVNWSVGRGLLALHLRETSEPLEAFLADLDRKVDCRSSGAVVYMASADGLPAAMRRVVRRFRVLHERVLLLTIAVQHVPRVRPGERVEKHVELGNGVHRLVMKYGYMEAPTVHADLVAALRQLGLMEGIEPHQIVYVLGRETFVASNKGRMSALWESLFGLLARNARNATDYFSLPADQVVEIGAHVDL